MREAGYYGAGTCEFLVGKDGTISFLEVNTRLQVEHPVTEEVSGIDLVREQFRIADGEELGYDDPPLRGHSIEFRINGEDPGRNFLPAPGALTVWHPPTGPGIRVDGGFQQGDVIGGNFDSLLAKLIVTGHDRQQAIERSRRALAEFEVEGIATAITFHRKVVSDPAFAPADPDEPFTVHTRWIETEFVNDIPAYAGAAVELDEPEARSSVVVEVGGKRVEVSLPEGISFGGGGGSAAKKAAPKRAPQEGRRRCHRRLAGRAHAGHDRQDRRRGGPGGRGRRPGRRPRGDEDGAAAQRPQGRRHHRADRRGRRNGAHRHGALRDQGRLNAVRDA